MNYLAVLSPLVYLWLFWWVFISVMGLYRAYLAKRLTRLTLVMGGPVLVLAGLLDVFCNLTLAWMVFLDTPHEWLVTDRLRRYKASKTDWRLDVADWVCTKLLDPFDPTGKHC